MKKIVILSALLALAGCNTPGRGTLSTIGPLPSAGVVATTPAYKNVVISTAIPLGAKVLGPVKGTACKNSLLDPAPTKADADIQLRQKAADMGATGVANVSYGSDSGAVFKNCWSIINATGTAYQSAK
jgi:hypothetical protein